MKNDKIDHTMDATRYLLATLEADLYKANDPYTGLIDLLIKFNVKSARDNIHSSESIIGLEAALNAACSNFGTPDELLMDLESFEAFKKFTNK